MSANKSIRIFATLSAISLLFQLSTRLLSSAGQCGCATCGAALCKMVCLNDCYGCCSCCNYFEVRIGRAAFPPPVLGPAVDAGASDGHRMYLPDMPTNDDDSSKPGRDKMEGAAVNVGPSGPRTQLQSAELWPSAKSLLWRQFMQYLYEPNHEQH